MWLIFEDIFGFATMSLNYVTETCMTDMFTAFSSALPNNIDSTMYGYLKVNFDFVVIKNLNKRQISVFAVNVIIQFLICYSLSLIDHI